MKLNLGAIVLLLVLLVGCGHGGKAHDRGSIISDSTWAEVRDAERIDTVRISKGFYSLEKNYNPQWYLVSRKIYANGDTIINREEITVEAFCRLMFFAKKVIYKPERP